jgi:vacuolar-type H+-ATPase subunit H
MLVTKMIFMFNFLNNTIMRKILLFAGIVLAFSFTGCGNKTKAPEKTADSDTVAATVVSPAADSITNVLSEKLSSKNPKDIQLTLQSLQTKFNDLVKAGKTADASAYASKVQAFINQHATEIKDAANGDATIASLVSSIKNLPTNAETTAKEAATAVKSDAENAATSAVSNAKTAAENKVNGTVTNAQNKASKAVTDAQDKANKEVEKANKKANDAVNKATNKALKGIGL